MLQHDGDGRDRGGAIKGSHQHNTSLYTADILFFSKDRLYDLIKWGWTIERTEKEMV